MNIQDFINEWTGKTVDFNHVFRFDSIDLILQYLYECFQVSAHFTTPVDFFTNPDPQVATHFDKLGGSDILAGDIILLHNPEHIVIATGNLNSVSFEALEQNGQTGDGSSQEGDFIRTRYIERERIDGLLRVKSVIPVLEPEPIVDVVIEPVVSPTPPFGALPVPVNVTDLTLVVSVKGYTSKTEAAKDVNAKIALAEGEYLLFAVADNGMMCIGQSRGGIKYWINPSDNQLPVPEVPEPTPMNWVDPRGNSVEPELEPTPEPVVEEPVIPDFTWKDTYHDFIDPRHYVCNIAYPATNIDPDTRPVSIMVRAGDDVTVYGYFYREGIKFHRLHAKSDIDYQLWVALPAVHKGRAVLVLPGPSWLDRIFHRYQQTKTAIFPIKVNGEDKWIDAVKLEPFKKNRK